MKPCYVYILKCADGSYYTGVTNDPERRLWEHDTSEDTAAYTFSRRPLRLVWYEPYPSPRAAIEVEKQIKGWSRLKKEALINGHYESLITLSKSKKQGEI